MTQGGGMCMSSLERYRVTGQISAQRITNYQENNVIISLPCIGQAK